MKIKLILIGLLFLINPNIEVIDIFPDFIGTILIILGINNLADIHERAAAAKKALLICTYLNAAKCLSIFTLLVISPSEMTWMLIFTMCFGLGEATLICYAFYQLAESISYTAMLESKESIFNKTNMFFGLSTAFICLRTVMSIFPELIYLNTDYGTVHSNPINWEFVTLMLYALNVLVVTAFGIVWYINTCSFFKTVGREKDYLAAIEEKYQKEVGSNVSLLTYRAFKTASILLLVGVMFMMTIRLDGIDLLPDFIGAILFFTVALRLYKLMPKLCKIIMITAGIYFVFSASEWFGWFFFSTTNYNTEETLISFSKTIELLFYSNSKVYNQYITLCVFSIIKALSAIVCILTVIPCIKKIIREHTGAIAELRTETTARKTAMIQSKLFIFLRIFTVLFILAAIIDPVSVCIYFEFPLFTLIATLFTGIAAIYTWLFNLKLTEAIENKYLY